MSRSCPPDLRRAIAPGGIDAEGQTLARGNDSQGARAGACLDAAKLLPGFANTCGQLKSKLGVHSLPELMRMAIQYLPSMPGKSIKDD